LLLRLIELARDAGAERVTLEVREANWVARRLYERFGFRPVAFLKSYYADTGENGVVMWLKPVPADRSGLPALADGLPDPANSALETDPA
jgi:ribosomal protein S18 acetylase RimI-like enzyme